MRLAIEHWSRVILVLTACSMWVSRPRGSIAGPSVPHGHPRPADAVFSRTRPWPSKRGSGPVCACRPELAPGHAPVDAVPRIAWAAARRIEAGALNDGRGLERLAQDLGTSTRQLRRAVCREFGVSPVELAQTQRLLVAKQLLTESSLPIIQVAFASGFESVRRFNALFRSHYRLTPTRMRRATTRRGATVCGSRWHIDPPWPGPSCCTFFKEGRQRALKMSRVIPMADGRCRWPPRVAQGQAGRRPKHAVRRGGDVARAGVAGSLGQGEESVRFLHARPDVIASHLANDSRLGARCRALPRLASPGRVRWP